MDSAFLRYRVKFDSGDNVLQDMVEILDTGDIPCSRVSDAVVAGTEAVVEGQPTTFRREAEGRCVKDRLISADWKVRLDGAGAAVQVTQS